MQAQNCPRCGAAAQIPPGVYSYECIYCKTPFQLAAPPAPEPEPPPRVIVVDHGASYRSGWSMYWMLRFGVAVIALVVTTGGWAWHRLRGDDDDIWDGTEPLACDGNDEFDVAGIKATFTAGAALIASGNCHVTCKDCALKAPIAVQASGNAQIILVNGSAEGTEASISASDNARVEVRGNASIIGSTKQVANAKIVGVAPPVATPPAAAAAAPAVSGHVTQHPTTPHPTTSASARKK